MLFKLALPIVAFTSALALAEPPAWKLTRDGVERHAEGRTTRVRLPGWVWAGPPYGRTLALGSGPRGEVLVTSDVLSTIWRIDPATLAVSVHALSLDAQADRDVGFVAIGYARAASAYFARGSIDGACWRVDAALRSARKLPKGKVVPLAAAGICVQE